MRRGILIILLHLGPWLLLFHLLSGSDVRERYYLHEKSHRRANGTAATAGKANRYFTGDAVLRSDAPQAKKPNLRSTE